MPHPLRSSRRLTPLAALALALAACDRTTPGGAVAPAGGTVASRAQPAVIGAGVLEAIRDGGSARIVVALAVDDPADAAPTSRERLSSLRQRVATAQAGALSSVADHELRVTRRYATVPAVAGIARSEAALRRLAARPGVRRIDLDVGGTGTLATSVPFIGADARHAAGNDGEGVVVAIFDTGIDTDHPDLADDVVDAACFGDDDGTVDGTGFCPDGSDRQTGAGAAEDDAGHGTHVSGIVTSRGTVSGAGVAPGAGIVAVKVLDDCSFSGCFYAFSEIVAALDYIITNNAALGVQLINMSLGTSTLYNGDCDNSTAGNMAGAAAINTLRNLGVLAFAASGNSSSGTQMGSPACLSNVIAVGSVNTSDDVAATSNSNASTDVFAPGVSILSLAVGGGTTTASGTSMASPHAAGCAALLIQSGDATTPDAIETRLETSDVQVTDPTNGLTFPRIDCSPPNAAPTADAGGPYAGTEGSPVAFDGSGSSDPDGDALTYDWDFGDGSTGSGVAPTHAYAADGSYTLTLTVSDGEETAVAMTSAIVANVAPTVDAGADGSVASGETLDFSGTFTDPGVLDAPWSWTIDWGTPPPTVGSTSDMTVPIVASRQFCAVGDYAVTLAVTDKDGDTGTDTRTVTVTAIGVPLDVTPGGTPNSVNLGSRGLLPVALLATATFDPRQVDPSTIRLGDGVGADTPVAVRNSGTRRATVEDVNGDGRPDLVLMFAVPALVANGDLAAGTTQLVLRAVLADGCTSVRATDTVRVVP